MNRLLLIVDVQNGFVTNEATEAIVPRINDLISKWKSADQPIVFSRFINKDNSPWARFMGWDKMQSHPETTLHQDLDDSYGEVYDKTAYSAWSDEIAQTCHANTVEEVVICGIDTDQCVLATAIAVFDAGLRPVVVTDCSASSNGKELHEAATMLLKGLIGEKQLLASSDL